MTVVSSDSRLYQSGCGGRVGATHSSVYLAVSSGCCGMSTSSCCRSGPPLTPLLFLFCPVCLHGGVQGLDTVPWDTLAPGTSKLFPASEGWPTSALVHRIVSPAGTDGFPLELEIEGLVNVEAPKTGEADVKGRVQVVLRAKIVDDGSEAVQHGTPVNLTVHWGFNTSEWSSEDVLGHRLYINASRKGLKNRFNGGQR